MNARLLLVADSHLAPGNTLAADNWAAVVDHVTATTPDAVLHLGDLTVNGAADPSQLGAALPYLERLDAPWRIVPGNHDVGDNPYGGADHTEISAERRGVWTDIYGTDRWRLDYDGWTVLALNAQLLDSGLDAEADQWAWLESELAGLDRNDGLMLALHKPLLAPAEEVAGSPVYRFTPGGPADRLLTVVREFAFGAVISGHVHQARTLDIDGIRHVWCPTSWATLGEGQPTFGFKLAGAVSIELTAGRPPAAELVVPDGISQAVIGETAPNPYEGHPSFAMPPD
ncbi:MAG: metallophosphoesterase family protein [Acidimicrobiales bacterium]